MANSGLGVFFVTETMLLWFGKGKSALLHNFEELNLHSFMNVQSNILRLYEFALWICRKRMEPSCFAPHIYRAMQIADFAQRNYRAMQTVLRKLKET